MTPAVSYPDLPGLATHLREALNGIDGNPGKKCVLLYAYNGTGKTRLSMHFRGLGKQGDARDTLYFNAFTEDLFTWDNDLAGDADRKLRLNRDSRFFEGLASLEMDNRIRRLLLRYADFDFVLEIPDDRAADWFVRFFRPEKPEEPIKVSRGEENIFVWCFFLAIAELAIAANEDAEPYAWVRFIYIDDPISSLDEHNAISVACHVASVLKGQDRVKAVISTHHTLFFNALHNELGKNPAKLFLSKVAGGYLVRDTKDTPPFFHVANIVELKRVADSGAVYTYHFNMLRSLMEKAASFHGLPGWKACVLRDADDPDGVLHERMIALFSHGGYSLFEPAEMVPENKDHFGRVLSAFLERFPFNPELFDQPQQAAG